MKKVLAFFVTLIVFNNSFAQSVGGSVGTSTTVCSGTNSGLLTLSGHTGNVVRWQSSTTGGASWSNISNTTANLVFSNLTATTWYRAEVLLAPSPPNISAYSTPAIITVDAASSGTISGSASVCFGSNSGTLTLSGTFTSIAQWDSTTDGGLNWFPISNTSASHNYSNLTTTTAYRASVVNGTCPAANASSATVTVNPVTVGGSVAGTTTVCAGSNNGVLSLSNNTGNIIRWQSSDDGGASWSNISNTTTAYNFSNLAQSMNYRAVVQSGNCLIENSTPATITVTPPSNGGSISSAATVCSATNTGTLILSGYTGNILQWEKSTDGGVIWTSITNTSDNYTYNNLVLSTMFRTVVKNGSCPSANSGPVSIIVSLPSAGGTVSGSDTVCNGTNSGTLTVSGYTGSILRWQSSDDGGITWSNISNTTGSNTCNYANITATTDYRAVVQNGSCPAANSLVGTVTVLPVSNGGTLSPAITSACSSGNNGTILLTGQSGTILRWESSMDGGFTWSQVTNTNSSLNYNNLTSSTLFRAFVQQGQCTAAYSSLAFVNVVSPTVGGSVSGNDTVCTGSNNGILTLNGHTGSILNWEYSKNGGITWSNVSNTTTTLNYTNLTTSTMYRAVLQNGSCVSANSSAGAITVNPVTVGGTILGGKTICDSLTAGTLTLTGYTGNILSWQSSIDTGNTWSTILNTSNTQLYSGITSLTLYQAILESPGCPSANSTTATISLSEPVAASFTFSTNGSSAVFTNTSASSGASNLWSFGDSTSSSVTNPAHTYISNGTYTVKLIVSDSCGSDTATQIIAITGLGVNETHDLKKVKCYPNPFCQMITFDLSSVDAASTLKLTDVYGNPIRTIAIEKGSKNFQLERRDLPSGIYFYQILSHDKIIATGKVVVQ